MNCHKGLLQGIFLLGASLPAHCLMINRGVESFNTLLIAALGGVLLYFALRFFMARLQKDKDRASPMRRYLHALLASALIFLA